MTDEDINALWTNLVHRSHNANGCPLSEKERVFYAVNLLRGSVARSGFRGYFENWSVETIADAHTGLRALGLHTPLAVLERAQSVILPGGVLPPSGSQISLISTELSEEEYEAEGDKIDEALSTIDTDFYKHDELIWNALSAYAEKNELRPK